MSDFRRFCVTVCIAQALYLTLRLLVGGVGMMSLDELARASFIVVFSGLVGTAVFGRKSA